LTRLSAIGAGGLTCVGQQREAEKVTAAGDFLSTPYRYMHKLSANFYTAVAAVFAHVKTSPEMCWQTVETKKYLLASGLRTLKPPPEDGR
jgi:hypothetical protein